MKKLLALIIVLVSGYFFFNQSSNEAIDFEGNKKVSSPDEISLELDEDEKNEDNSKKKVSLFSDVESVDLNKFVDNPKSDPRVILEKANKVIKNRVECIVNNSCKEFNENHPYNDPNNTKFHRELSSALDVADVVLEKDRTFVKDLDNDLLVKALGIDNFDIRFQALKFLLLQEDAGLIESASSQLMKVEGKDSASVINVLSSNKLLSDDNSRKVRNDLVSNYITQGDYHTLSQVSKKLASITLSDVEINNAIDDFCKRDIPKISESEKMIYYNFTILAQKNNLELKCSK